MKNLNYTIKDTKRGLKATIEFPEGTKTVSFKPMIDCNKRCYFETKGCPSNYDVTYMGGNELVILERNENARFQIGTRINHVKYGVGYVVDEAEAGCLVDFNGNRRPLLKSILSNFIK